MGFASRSVVKLVRILNATMSTRTLQRLVLFCLIVFALASCKSQSSIRILLIGNSFITYNGGVAKQLQAIAPSADIAEIAVGGYTLEDHWNKGDALKTIQQGGRTFVVLQEQSQTPVFSRQKFFDAVRKFNSEILKNKATTILLMTWERPDSARSGVTAENLASAYQSIGTQLGIIIAPAGLAFARSRREKPELALSIQDGHPTPSGTFLAACVLYAKLMKQNPIGNAYTDASIAPEVGNYLKRVAWETVDGGQ